MCNQWRQLYFHNIHISAVKLIICPVPFNLVFVSRVLIIAIKCCVYVSLQFQFFKIVSIWALSKRFHIGYTIERYFFVILPYGIITLSPTLPFVGVFKSDTKIISIAILTAIISRLWLFQCQQQIFLTKSHVSNSLGYINAHIKCVLSHCRELGVRLEDAFIVFYDSL